MSTTCETLFTAAGGIDTYDLPAAFDSATDASAVIEARTWIPFLGQATDDTIEVEPQHFAVESEELPDMRHAEDRAVEYAVAADAHTFALVCRVTGEKRRQVVVVRMRCV